LYFKIEIKFLIITDQQIVNDEAKMLQGGKGSRLLIICTRL